MFDTIDSPIGVARYIVPSYATLEHSDDHVLVSVVFDHLAVVAFVVVAVAVAAVVAAAALLDLFGCSLLQTQEIVCIVPYPNPSKTRVDRMMMMMMMMMITMTQREALDNTAAAADIAAAAVVVVDEGIHSCSYRLSRVVDVGVCLVVDDVLVVYYDTLDTIVVFHHLQMELALLAPLYQ
jgi:hypothetical protein